MKDMGITDPCQIGVQKNKEAAIYSGPAEDTSSNGKLNIWQWGRRWSGLSHIHGAKREKGRCDYFDPSRTGDPLFWPKW